MAAKIRIKSDGHITYNSFIVARVLPNGFTGSNVKDAPKAKLLTEALADLVSRLDRDGYFDE